jgi:hypothetical protein
LAVLPVWLTDYHWLEVHPTLLDLKLLLLPFSYPIFFSQLLTSYWLVYLYNFFVAPYTGMFMMSS